jgi:hypothetical protein
VKSFDISSERTLVHPLGSSHLSSTQPVPRALSPVRLPRAGQRRLAAGTAGLPLATWDSDSLSLRRPKCARAAVATGNAATGSLDCGLAHRHGSAGWAERERLFTTMNASARNETRAEVDSEVHFSHDVSERLVTTDEEMTAKAMAPSGASSGVEQPTPRRRTFLTPLLRRRPSPGAAGTTTPFDHNVTSRGERTQQGIHQATPAAAPESMMTDQEQLASLQLRAAMAEATARLMAAEQATAHLLAAREREDTLSRQSRSRSRTPTQLPRGTAHI